MKLPSLFRRKSQLVPASTSGTSWWLTIRESFAGAWQRNVDVRAANVLAYWAVYACIQLISGDIAKMRLKLVQKGANGVWTEVTEGSPFLPLMRRPNGYQTRVQFWRYWYSCLLVHGNTYALKERDARGVVIALYILDPTRVVAMVGEDGSVFYQLKSDHLSGLFGTSEIIVPASEVIHDRMTCLHHPLVGVSPIYACGVAATQGLSIQNNSSNFFSNASMPGGIIKIKGSLDADKKADLRAQWDTLFGGENRGKTAVLADAMEYQPLSVTARDAQMIEQLRMTAEMVCSTFGVPPYKVGVGAAPGNISVAATDQAYYSQSLQILIEGTENVLDEGLGLSDASGRPPGTLGVEFDLKALIRMDPAAQMEFFEKGIQSAIFKPNEARAEFDLQPVEGGDTPYLQQQNFSLAALNQRDQGEDPFGTDKPETPPAPQPTANDDPTEIPDDQAMAVEDRMLRHLLPFKKAA